MGFRNFSRKFIKEKRPPEEGGLGLRRRSFGFAGLSRGAGATSLAQSFAYYLQKKLSERITYTEISFGKAASGMPYDKIGLDLRGGEGFDEGIVWNLRKYPESLGEKDPLTVASCAKLMLAPKTNAAVFDIESGVCEDAEIAEVVFPNLDDIVVVIDPLPSLMINMREKLLCFKELEFAGKRVAYVINKMNAGVLRSEMTEFLRVKKFIEIPSFPAEKIYSNEYGCLPIIEDREIREQLAKPFEKILGRA
jgi:hypothetical protein